MLVGAPRHAAGASGAGAAYVFTRSGAAWSQHNKLVAQTPVSGSTFGYSVALHGDTAMAGARKDSPKGAQSGSVWVLSAQ